MRGNLIFIRNNSWIGSKIRLLTKCEYNHVGIFSDEKNIIEAKFIGVRKTSLEHFKKYKAQNKLDYSFYKINTIGSKQKEDLVKFCEDRINNKYDFLQLLSLLVFIVFKIDRNKEPIDERHKWICSELLAEGAEQAGFKFQNNVNSDIITPADILNSKLVEKI